MQHVILTIILLFSSIFLSQAQESSKNLDERNIKVTVVNALNDRGTVKFAFYTKESFRKKPLFAKTADIKDGISSVNFKNIPKGEYAIVCFHDENENNRMDFYENGMPKESYGTSNNVMNMGPPDFESSKFEVNDKDLTFEIKF